MVQSLCAGYHLSLHEAFKMTLPQVIMLNHAAWAERENGERRYEAKKLAKEKQDADDPVIPEFGNKRMSEIQEDPALLDAYMSHIGDV